MTVFVPMNFREYCLYAERLGMDEDTTLHNWLELPYFDNEDEFDFEPHFKRVVMCVRRV